MLLVFQSNAVAKQKLVLLHNGAHEKTICKSVADNGIMLKPSCDFPGLFIRNTDAVCFQNVLSAYFDVVTVEISLRVESVSKLCAGFIRLDNRLNKIVWIISGKPVLIGVFSKQRNRPLQDNLAPVEPAAQASCAVWRIIVLCFFGIVHDLCNVIRVGAFEPNDVRPPLAKVC